MRKTHANGGAVVKNLRDYMGVAIGIVVLLVAAGFIGWAIGNKDDKTAAGGTTTAASSTTIDPKVASGAHTFVQFACAQCHGPQGKGGISPDVPTLTTVGPALTEAQLRQIIDHGLGVVADPKKPFMPVWGKVISDSQVNDLVAYIKAGLPEVPGTTPLEIPQGQGDVAAGAALYQRDGCINCHGPSGLGGVPNPATPDKVIPSLGADFRAEFNTDAKIIDVIASGSVLGKQPIVSMPHWGGIISEQELQQLATYIKTFN
jgi:mono/diheme cytochrome c family protein